MGPHLGAAELSKPPLCNNEPVVLSSVVKGSPGRLERQLWWDPGTRARTQGGGVQQRGFLGGRA